ncbi:LysR substrate-binding domain-containing protein [Chromohalobacter sp. 11-W]|uniref:LysR substrate-binding domain-containing protein n=1 Tax=Chromohalobacter sp. 11-W TaxID=2994061 RepID=UPI0024699063|nr:LysR substrate-binding domain-containing protein [Chromohalobacter sp. 11-W]
MVRVGALNDSSLVARRLVHQHFVVCASPGYLERWGVPSTPDALSEHNCLIYKGTCGQQPWYFRDPGARKYRARELRGNLRSNNAESLLEACFARPRHRVVSDLADSRGNQRRPVVTDSVGVGGIW